MDDLVKEIKKRSKTGSAVGAPVTKLYKIGSQASNSLEPACWAGLKSALLGKVAKGLIGATALGSSSIPETTGRNVHTVHQNIRQQHDNSHPLTDSCILCNPNNLLDI